MFRPKKDCEIFINVHKTGKHFYTDLKKPVKFYVHIYYSVVMHFLQGSATNDQSSLLIQKIMIKIASYKDLILIEWKTFYENRIIYVCM